MELVDTTLHSNPDNLDSLVNTENQFDIRWQIVCDNIRNNMRPSTRQDRFIWAAYKYRKAAMSVKSLNDRVKLCRKHATVAAAIEYYRDTHKLRAFMEALSLCDDLTMSTQARYMGIGTDVIEMYEKLFFDVRHKRRSKGYIVSKLLNPDMTMSYEDAADPMFMWKLIAVHGGFKILKSCLYYGKVDEAAIQFHGRAGLAALAMKFGIANWVRPVNTFSVSDITEQQIKVNELKHKVEQDNREVENSISVNQTAIERILENVQPIVRPMDGPLMQIEPRVTARIGSEEV